MSEQTSSKNSLRVSVLVDLIHRPDAGGHVKAWERLAAAASGVAGLDLTVHFAGEEPALRRLADNVRYRLHRPAFSTARLPFLSHVPDHADLAPHHPSLARHLEDADLIHTTDAYFAFAHTAERSARRRGVALTNSVHTDTPRYTRLFTAQTIERFCGGARLGRLLGERFDLPGRMEARMRRRLLDHQRLCSAALVSRRDELPPLARALGPGRVTLLRRGIDRDLFSPARRDRRWLETAFGVPAESLLVLFVGRIDRGKNIHTLADAVDALGRAGRSLHLFCAGEGADRPAVAERLGPAATCPGTLLPADLARVYAAADVVAHPSEIEESSNVVLEALASGRPLVTSAAVAAGSGVVDGETGLVAAAAPADWSAALERLAADAVLRDRLGREGRRWIESTVPTWRDVLEQDLLPVWRDAQARARP
ncbi:MAG TPA: glycosyltransferase [Polyangia bacterium]|jgi:glycosyltransferase involved in cell wall biosynthesis